MARGGEAGRTRQPTTLELLLRSRLQGGSARSTHHAWRDPSGGTLRSAPHVFQLRRVGVVGDGVAHGVGGSTGGAHALLLRLQLLLLLLERAWAAGQVPQGTADEEVAVGSCALVHAGEGALGKWGCRLGAAG
eukprot:1160277-Pelagomonas_calceolata.AAC.23